MTERSAERRVRQETGWLAGGPLLRVPTIRHTTDTFHFVFHTTNVLLFKYLCNIVIGVGIIKELQVLVDGRTPCIILIKLTKILLTSSLTSYMYIICRIYIVLKNISMKLQ
jgi:hypothetical protein